MTKEYQISGKDIEGMLNYLKIFHPEKATRNYAEEILEYLKAGYHRMAFTNPDALEDLYQAFQQSKTCQNPNSDEGTHSGIAQP
jgi:hypothetical protein